MENPGLIVIGSGPAGISAAEAFRESDADTGVVVVTADADAPYARPPLSKEFLRGTSDDVDLHPPEWFAERRIDRRHGSRVDAIHPDEHAITIGGERLSYSALVIATGAAPAPLAVDGGELALSLRSLEDARRLRTAGEGAASAVVVGAGFIGCEAAASLAHRGVEVTLVAPERLPQEKRLGAGAGERLRDLVTAAGATYRGGVSVQRITRQSDRFDVTLDDGTSIACDMVLAATGVTPQTDLAESAGLDIRDGRIVVDASARTSAADVYAAGDVALTYNEAAGRHVAVEHWQDADDQGAIAGTNAAGGARSWDAVPGFWSTIGEATIKYTAWGDGYDRDQLIDHGDGFTVWYERDGATVGVLTLDADDDYDTGQELITQRRPPPAPR